MSTGHVRWLRAPDNREWWTLVALESGLPLAIVAQYILCYRAENWRVGLAADVVAVVLFAWGASRQVHRLRADSRRSHVARRILIVALAIILVLWAADLAKRRPPVKYPNAFALLPWAAGVILAVTALSWKGDNRALRVALAWSRRVVDRALALMASFCKWADRGWVRRAARRDTTLIGLLFVGALGLRLVGLASFPDVMSGDEGVMALEAQRVLRGELTDPFGVGWLEHPNLYFYLLAGSLQLLGRNLFALRFPAAFLGALGVPAVYVLAKGAFGRETAWVSAAFAAGWGLPLQLSRLGLNNSADVLFGAAALAFLQRGLVGGRRRGFIAAGLMLGASLYFYAATRLLIPITMAALILSGIKRLRRRWRGLLVFVLVALLVSGPLVTHYVRHPNLFLPRRSIGLLQSGALARQAKATGKAEVWLLLKQLGPSMTAFVYTRDASHYYQPETPMLYVFSGALFVLGLGLALKRWREVRYATLLVWIGLTVTFGGWLLTSPPNYQRYLIAAPAVCLLVGRAATVWVRQVARLLNWRRAMRHGIVGFLGILLLGLNAGYYFGVYVPECAFKHDRNTWVADRTARRMAALEPEHTTYFLGAEGMRLVDFKSVPFLAPDAEWVDVEPSPAMDWSFVREDRGAHFVIMPARESELALLQEQFPGGEQAQIVGCQGQVLATVYQVVATDVP